MSAFIAALPMYDWPETRAGTDARWVGIRDALRAAGFEAPEALVRRNGDLPPVPGGIRDAEGRVIAPDPATLPPDELDLHLLWRHPALLLAQTCWGPMEQGLSSFVEVVAQPDYSDVEGGQGPLYSSAVLMRGDVGAAVTAGRGHLSPVALSPAVPSPADGSAFLPLERLRGGRLAYNGPDSMSGIIALTRDLAALGEDVSTLFSDRLETGSHRASIRAVAEGRADACAIDCRSWDLARRHEPAAQHVVPAGWTARRPGLPLITSRHTPEPVAAALREILARR